MDRSEPTVSNSSLGHPSNNRNATATPPPGSVKPQSTPSSRHADSYALALSSQGKRVVPKENQYLAVDLAQTKTVDPKRFASLILNMDLADLGASSESQQSKTNRKRGREDDSTPTPSSKKVSSSSRNRNSTSAKLDKINQDQESKEFNKDAPEGYARDMLSHGIFRSHAILIMLDDAMCRFVYYDHSAIVQSEARLFGLCVFDIRVDRTLFLKMLEQLHALNAQQLGIIPGLDTKFMKDPESLKKGVNLKWANIGEGPPSKWVLEGCFYTFPTPDGQERTVELGEVLFRSNGIIGRGTIVVRVKCTHKHGCRKGGPCDWEGLKLVMKINFPSEGRPSEPEIIKRCTDMAIERREKWGRLMAEFPDTYEARVIRGSIQEELKPLMKLEASRQFAQVIYDVFQCHEWVYTHPKVLHRDISQSNIMAREENGNLYGVFETTSGHLSLPLITELVPDLTWLMNNTRLSWQGPPRYRHDLESLFYVMLIMACHYTKPGVKAKELPYLKWFTLGDELLFNCQTHSHHNSSMEIPPIDDFFVGFKPCLRPIQRSLRRGVIWTW
ncbi:hypothetical protein BT96DRAFT_1000587 [Gymnopus androsaceus JB14]|uniref:Fungal-type protein kinase domain-containing protein n=1 Tax=Gymnopus androsaceus JB14 TaxID=1447944 RepID=A0A6A4H347_9AGAR|nr:hypothetical protein BT96DRAFT_1000587 [Gymnopus androsaceus JB14]